MHRTKPTQSRKILHIEDDADNREMVRLMLPEHQVTSVGTYAEGLVSAKQDDFETVNFERAADCTTTMEW